MADEPQSTLDEDFSLKSIVDGIVGDLNELRAGRISVADARVRAELAKQVLRGIGYAVQAQKFLAGQAAQLPGPEDAGKRRR